MQFADPIFGWFLSWGNEDHNGIQELVAVSEIWTFLICLLYFSLVWRIVDQLLCSSSEHSCMRRKGCSGYGYTAVMVVFFPGHRIIGFNSLILVSVSHLYCYLISVVWWRYFPCANVVVAVVCHGSSAPLIFSSRRSKSRTMFLRSAFSAHLCFSLSSWKAVSSFSWICLWNLFYWPL